jgi:long-chain acyl-CoA synthetase
MSARSSISTADKFWVLGKGPIEPGDLEAWTVPRILAVRSRLEPDMTIYRARTGSGFRNTSWSQLYAEVVAIAAGLSDLGLKRHDRIAILGTSSPLWISFDLAILSLGGITVGIYPNSPAPQFVDQLDHVGASALVILDHPGTAQVIKATRGCNSLGTIICQETATADSRIVAVMDLIEAGTKVCADQPDLVDGMVDGGHIDDPMRLFFTSGSTGKQKAVIHTQRSLMLSADAAVIRNPSLRKSPQRVLAFLPLSHISPVINNLLLPLITSTVAYFPGDDPDLISLIRQTRPTYLALMPRQYQKLVAQLAEKCARYSGIRGALLRRALATGSDAIKQHWSGQPVSRLRGLQLWCSRRIIFRPLLKTVGLDEVTRAQTTSAAMPRDVAALWCVYGLDLREGYGSTEAPVIACQLDPFPEPGAVGRKMPKPWFEVKFAPDGEIVVKSATLFSEYWNDPQATQSAKDGDWYRTGDIGEINKRGDIRLIGRKTEIIITAGGKTLNPQDIEAPFRNCPYLSEIVIIGEARKFVSALIELSGEAVQTWARQNLETEFSSYDEMVGSDPVKKLIGDEIERRNASLPRVAQVKKFRILPRPLEAKFGEVTATRKAKRSTIIGNFSDLVEDIYISDEDKLVSAKLRNLKL